MLLRITCFLLLAASAATMSGCGGGYGALDPAATATAAAPTTTTPPATTTSPVTAAPLPSSSIAVAPALGVINVAWVAPTIKADGTPLTDLAGFRILVGTASGAYSSSVTVADPSATSFSLVDLPPASYYVVVIAYDAANNESLPSAEVSKTIH